MLIKATLSTIPDENEIFYKRHVITLNGETKRMEREANDDTVALKTIVGLRGKPKIAYFSMEIGIDENIPTYSGGLGILAGDTIKSCADLNVPVVGVTLLSENGYFYQKIDENGNQIELSIQFAVPNFLELLPTITSVNIEDREVKIRAWYYQYKGVSDYNIPVFFLDSNIEGNSDWNRKLTKHLYGGIISIVLLRK